MALIEMTKAAAREDWSRKFDRWSVGPSTTESEKCENAERMIRDAIKAHEGLKARTIKVFAQGSYCNRTNVRLDSDVDICVLCLDTFYPDYGLVPGVNNAALKSFDATYHFPELKRDVEEALVAKFGRKAVTAGDKAFDVKANTYRVAADVVPTFEGRLYYWDHLGQLKYHSGTVLQCSSSGRRINNWPEQHYTNGVQRHSQTSRQFKKKVRCLKNLCNEMASKDIASAKAMASFLLESLVYNCPDRVFEQVSHYEDMKYVIAYLWNATQTDDTCREMVEVNGIKYLFHWSQPWERSTAHQFLFEAWQYVGFTNE